MKIAIVTFLMTIVGTFSVVWGKSSVNNNDKHQFQGLKLKGQLKKPDLTYIYKRKGIRAEKILNIPENFNDEALSDSRKL